MYAYPELLETQNYFSDNQNENFNTSFEDETIKTIYQEPAPVRDYAPIEIMPPNKIQLNETKDGAIFDAVKVLNEEKPDTEKKKNNLLIFAGVGLALFFLLKK